MRRYRHTLVLALSVGLLLGGCGFGQVSGTPSGDTNNPAVAPGEVEEGVSEGKRLPDVALRTFANDTIHLNEIIGQPLIMNFWATWCGPCREEIPLLQQAYAAHKDEGLRLIAITDETKDVVEPFIRDQGMSFPIMFDTDGHVSNTYHIQGIPTTFFLDRNGVVLARHVGALGPNLLKSYLEDLLRQPGGAPAPTDRPPAPTDRPVPPQPVTPSPLPLRERIGARYRLAA